MLKKMKQPVSRVLFLDNHLSGIEITFNLKRFFRSGRTTFNLQFNLAFCRGLLSQYLPVLLVKLLTHRCTIACDFRPSAVYVFSACAIIDCSVPFAFAPLTTAASLCSCLLSLFAQADTALTPADAFIPVALSTDSRRPDFLRRPVLECTDFPHIFPTVPSHRSSMRDYPAASFSILYYHKNFLLSDVTTCQNYLSFLHELNTIVLGIF